MFENQGIGIDVVDITRFRNKQFKKNQSFYGKIFTKSEIMYCKKFKDPYPHFAGKFAMKEAVIKSIPTKISFSEIETSHLNSRPIIKTVRNNEEYNFISSVSHDGNFAVAAVISEKIK